MLQKLYEVVVIVTETFDVTSNCRLCILQLFINLHKYMIFFFEGWGGGG